MKKFLIASGVAVLAFASVAGAQGYTFNTNLTVGSTGADVVALQTALISAGFDIPAISSGAAAKGYFGSQTAAAVKAYQASRGIPNTGFVGPLTRAAMNAGAVGTAPTTPGVIACPVGFVCTPVAGGTPTTGSPAGITTVGIPGTVTVDLRSTPSNGTDVKKGEEKVIASYDVEADDSDMQISNVALNFNKRLWLYAESVTLLDGSNVIATKSGLSSSDFTEVSSGSDYRIRFSGFNYVVPANAKKTLSVRVKMLSFTDRTADTITLGNLEVRAVDGTGVSVTVTEADDRTFDFDATNVGNIVTTVNASSPISRIVQTSTTGTTDNVVLMVFDLKAENRNVEVDEIRIGLAASKALASFGTLFDDVFIEVDGKTFSANTLASTTVFTDLDVMISRDQKKSFRVLANIADADDYTDGIMASTTLTANATNIVGEDSGYDDATVSSATIISSDVTFLQTGVAVSGASVVVSPVGDSTSIVSTDFKFTLTAGDKNPIYVSAVPSTLVATSTTASSSSLTLIDANLSTIPGDSTGVYYVIPAGASRQFTLTGSMNNTNGTSGAKEFKITRIYFDDDTTGLQEFSIDFGLEGLRATRTLTN